MSDPRFETVLVTRFCRHDMKSNHNDFKWPTSGPVSCPDWDPTPVCGHGLHGWLHGKGDSFAWSNGFDDKMLVVEVLKSDIVDLGGKVKFPKGTVVHCGDRQSVTQYMKERGHVDVMYGEVTVSDGETALYLGMYGKATAGANGTAIAGDYGKATAGANGTAIAGFGGTAMVGLGGKAKAGGCGRVEVQAPNGYHLLKLVQDSRFYCIGKRGTLVRYRKAKAS